MNGFKKTVTENLSCLATILTYNVFHGMFFFRITSDPVPFASHPVFKFPWQKHFADEFGRIGEYVKVIGSGSRCTRTSLFS